MTTESDRKSVLMADDDAEDCMLATQAFADSGAQGTFSCVEDGVELMSYLSERSHSRTERLPALILLDLNMPKKDGRKALFEIKADPLLRRIPIVVLTTSEEKQDMDLAMEAGAESFITKPTFYDDWVRIMKSLAGSWLAGE